jgi:thioredoxin-related protein
MRRTILWMMAACVCSVNLLSGQINAADREQASLEWQPDLHSAHRLAVQTNKPMLLVFGAEWCGWCKRLEKTTLEDPHMVEYINSSFVPIRIDVDQQKRVAEILEVSSLPCTIVLSPQADLLGRIEGFELPAGLYKKLAAAKKRQDQVSPASARQGTATAQQGE